MVFRTQADAGELSNAPTAQKHLTLVINVIVAYDECAHVYHTCLRKTEYKLDFYDCTLFSLCQEL